MSQFAGIIWSAQKTRVECKTSGATAWTVLTGVGSITASGGDAPTTETATFENTQIQTGAPRPPTFEIDMPGFVASLKVYRDMIADRNDQKVVEFRLSVPEETVATTASTATAAVAATTGAVTLAGSGYGSDDQIFADEDRFGPGLALKVGTNYYTIESIAADGALKVLPATAQSASAYSIVKPPLKQNSFAARIITYGNLTAEAEGNVSTSLTIAPTAVLPAMEVGKF